MVDHEDKIHVAGEQFSEQTTRPLFKGFWQHGMVSVGESVIDYVPSLLIGKFLFVNQDSEQLNSADGGMSIV